MSGFLKRHLKLGLALAGAAMFAFFAWKAFGIRAHLPPAADEVARAAANNAFAKKGFFALVGLFVLLFAALPGKLRFIPKIAFSTGLVALIVNHMLSDGKIADIIDRGVSISAPWMALAFLVQALGMSCTIWRWKVLLDGQGFRIPLKHLVGSFLIGRFIGSFAPGTSGLDGYRAYDIARTTGEVARSISVIVVEKLTGFFVLGTLLLLAVPVGRELFAQRHVNAGPLVVVSLLFVAMMLVPIVVLFRPGAIRLLVARLVPAASPVRPRIDKAILAVTVYEHRKGHLMKALAIAFGVHLGTIGMYFCTSRALHEAPAASGLFATAVLMIGATILPLSIAGIGMREGVFAFFLGPVAALYAFAGYVVGEIISVLGGPVWLARRSDYYEVMKAQRDAVNRDVEDIEDKPLPSAVVPDFEPPSVRGYALTGLSAGLLAGLAVAFVDAARLWHISGAGIDLSLPGYGALTYGPLCGLVGAVVGAAMALLGRLVQRPAAPRVVTGSAIGVSIFFVLALAVGWFFLFRDVFEEKASLASPRFLGAFAAYAAALLAVCVASCLGVRRLFSGDRRKLARPGLGFAHYVVIVAILIFLWATSGNGTVPKSRPAAAAAGRPNVVLVMCDTLRADHVGVYGDTRGLTPHLDALARDGVVFANAFAQATWTRPSVGTILTGRYPSSHTAIHKGSILPDEVTTLAEVMESGGYETLATVSNYNLAPFFNFQQGFAEYHYLSPNLPLWSSDAQSKLILIEILKKVQARLRGDRMVPSDYYVVGEDVTRIALVQLDKRMNDRPFFQFISYMDPHDPYFRHPFDGYGIARRGNENPDPSRAPEMRGLYAGEVKYWDESFGAFLDGLRTRGLYDRTMVVVVADHGEEFAEHGGFWHGSTLYDEQVRVPFVAKLPKSSGAAGGARVSDWMRLLDVAPFVIENAGLKVPAEMQGAPAPREARTPVYAEEDHEGNVLSSIRYVKDGAENKLILANEKNPRGLKPVELYRTDTDPREKIDLTGSSKATCVEAGRLLDAHQKAARKGAAKARSGELTSDAAAQLRNLGYMNDQ
ncbi:MAG: sulfatase-like hydrolase/transferase [Deltaproteobacteria bacterium]|nr:sulfatase-like hydrolase/transferase [Deltaproteobacteria bacterium]